MKMKEVMAATGLPEKTVRYYEDRGLITPETYRQNGRTYHEYSPEDVSALKHIVILRQAQFTLEEIHRMQEDADTLPEILKAHQDRLIAQKESLEALSDLSEMEAKSWDELAKEIERRNRTTPDYQPRLRFAEMDPESEAEREAELERVRYRHAHPANGTRIAIISLSVACAILAAILIGVMIRSVNTVTVPTESTAGWYYYLAEQGLMRTRDLNEPGELVCERTTMGSTISWRVGEHQIYVLIDNNLYSMDPDGSNRHAYKPKYTSAYAGGEENGLAGTPLSFHLHEAEIIVMESSGGQLGGGDRYLVRIPVDDGKKKKIGYELQDGYDYYTALRGDILYILEMDQSSDGDTSVIRYDLLNDTVMDRTLLDLPVCSPAYLGVEPEWYFEFWDGSDPAQGITTSLYQVHSELIQGEAQSVKLVDELPLIDGRVQTVYGHYAVYQGDYETLPVDDPFVVAENEAYAASISTYLMNLETGVQFLLDSDYRYLNFFPDGLLLTGRNGTMQWLEYP